MRKNMIKIAIVVIFLLAIVISLSMVLFRDRAGEMMQEAMDLRNKERYIEAADLYGQIAILHPDSEYADDSLFEMGFTYYVISYPKANYEDKGVYLKMALKAFNKIVEDYPESGYQEKTRIYMAEIYSILGKIDEALENYEVASGMVKDQEKLQEIFQKMATNYELQADYNKSIEYLKKIIEINIPGRENENAYLALARYYRIAASNNNKESNAYHSMVIDLMEGLLESNEAITETSHQEALMIKAHSLLELKRFDETRLALSRLEKMNVTPTNRALIEDYKDRLKRHSEMGK
jgi:tetratricopeptide (TPR) repeat protein